MVTPANFNFLSTAKRKKNVSPRDIAHPKSWAYVTHLTTFKFLYLNLIVLKIKCVLGQLHFGKQYCERKNICTLYIHFDIKILLIFLTLQKRKCFQVKLPKNTVKKRMSLCIHFSMDRIHILYSRGINKSYKHVYIVKKSLHTQHEFFTFDNH